MLNIMDGFDGKTLINELKAELISEQNHAEVFCIIFTSNDKSEQK